MHVRVYACECECVCTRVYVYVCDYVHARVLACVCVCAYAHSCMQAREAWTERGTEASEADAQDFHAATLVAGKNKHHTPLLQGLLHRPPGERFARGHCSA